MQQWDQLVVKDGILWRCCVHPHEGNRWLQLVIPLVLREAILKEAHEGISGGHLGQEKTLYRLKERFYWPGHFNEVRNWCLTCKDCATRKTHAPARRAPLGTVTAGYPTQVMAVDLVGPLPQSPNGNSYILVVGDYFTRWMEALPIPNQEATTVASKLVDEIFLRFSIPEQLHSDQGAQFESQLMSEVCNLLHIHKTRTTPYHPQCDGLVERFNRTLLNMLATCASDHPFDWEQYIRKVCMAYNSSVQASTGYTPFYLMFWRQARLPLDVLYGTCEPAMHSPSVHATTLHKQMAEAFALVRSRLATQHLRQKEFYNQKVHGQPYASGDLVWLHSPVISRGQSRKLHHPWTGPFKVIKRLSEVTYRIQKVEGRRQRKVVHFDRLKPCPPNIRLNSSDSNSAIIPSPAGIPPSSPLLVGENIELVEDDSYDQQLPITSSQLPTPTCRYPHRTRRPPPRYDDYIPYS